MDKSLISSEALRAHLRLEWGGDVEDLLAPVLLDPVKEFLSRPGKRFRGKLVEMGFRLLVSDLSMEQTQLCARASALLETLHAGSLVVDDIQDDSEFRRGQPTLHRQHGVPLALNAGNWLYFWPLDGVREWGLAADQEVCIYRLCHETLFRAHFGQALDLGVPIDELAQSRIPEVSWASLELKTGALMGLGIALGGLLAGGTDEEIAKFSRFGNAFGIALQMFDDLGNLGSSRRETDPKQLEDLRLRRPSAVWAIAAETQSPESFTQFIESVKALPEDEKIWAWISEHDFIRLGKIRAGMALQTALTDLDRDRNGKGAAAWKELKDTAQRLTESYG